MISTLGQPALNAQSVAFVELATETSVKNGIPSRSVRFQVRNGTRNFAIPTCTNPDAQVKVILYGSEAVPSPKSIDYTLDRRLPYNVIVAHFI